MNRAAEQRTTGNCDCCANQPSGVMLCEDGTVRVLSNYPTTGGPWMPAYNTQTGDWVWVNAGNISLPVEPPM